MRSISKIRKMLVSAAMGSTMLAAMPGGCGAFEQAFTEGFNIGWGLVNDDPSPLSDDYSSEDDFSILDLKSGGAWF